MNLKNLTKHIMLEAIGDEHINRLVEQAIDAALGAVSFDTLKSNFEQAKTQYYSALKSYLAKRLDVDPAELGRFVTSDMKNSFEDALQKNYEALQPTADKESDRPDPKMIVED